MIINYNNKNYINQMRVLFKKLKIQKILKIIKKSDKLN